MDLDRPFLEAETIAQGGDNGGVDTGHRGGAEIDGDAIGFPVVECGEESFSAGHCARLHLDDITGPSGCQRGLRAFAMAARFQYAATMRIPLTCAALFISALAATGQPPKMDTILYGAAYYHEY